MSVNIFCKNVKTYYGKDGISPMLIKITSPPLIWVLACFYRPFLCYTLPLVCKNICERICSKIFVTERGYFAGKKYCRRCEIYLYHKGVFCPCCGLQLRTTPSNKRGKERLRLREQEKRY